MGTTSVSKCNTPTAEDVDEMLSDYGIDPHKMIQCPACAELCGNMRLIIAHLNDTGSRHSIDNAKIKYFDIENHSWTFKQIGKWLEGLGY